jgi:endonuclease-3
MLLWEQVAYLAADEKRAKAFEALRSRIGTSAIAVAGAGKAALVEIAALGGIFAELRAERMRESASMVIKDFGGDLDSVLALPAAKAKKALQRFPMIGEPGPEKILLFCGKLEVLALESNGLRVLTRSVSPRKPKATPQHIEPRVRPL